MHESTLFARMEEAASRGAKRLAEPARLRAFVEERFDPTGGCRGRGPHPDLYYTAYGLLVLHALDAPPAAASTVDFVSRSLDDSHRPDLIHLAAAVQCLRLAPTPPRVLTRGIVRERLSAFEAPQGGGWHTVHNPRHASPYGCYLAMAVGMEYDAVDNADVDRALRAMEVCRSADGGYANSPGAAQGLVPATAAAIAALAQADRPVPPEALGWLSSCQNSEGGFAASPLLPWADLLSTGTAVFALALCQIAQSASSPNTAAAARFVDRMATLDGGFRGSAFDAEPDVEYAFHALLALSSLPEDTPAGLKRSDVTRRV